MRARRLLPVALAAAGLVAIVAGIHQDLVHVGSMYDGTVTSGWDGPLNHEEVLLAQLAAVGAIGTAAALRWRYLAAVPLAVAGVVGFYTGRAVLHFARDPGLYTEVSTYAGAPIRLVLGAEPFLLAAGALLLGIASVDAWRTHGDWMTDPGPSSESSSPA